MNSQNKCKMSSFLLLIALLVMPTLSGAVVMNDYCITPPFITAGVKPNLLMMMDNSASMYDLAYIDRGKKHCAIATGTSCSYDSDCTTTGDTCSVFDRSPYYCFDQTYSSANSYYGYFDKDKHYTYRTGTDDFAEVAAFPDGCPTSVANTTKLIASTMCLEYEPGTGTVVRFVAKGNYLNWMTASKFDIQKKILTGGKFDGTGLVPESRGCVGQGYLKHALSADFVNFNTGAADTNKPNALGVTFTINGPQNPFNITAPSTGGETFINIYAGRVYDYGACQKAMDDIVSGNLGTVKASVADCLADTGATAGYCRLQPSLSCTTNSPDCDTPVVAARCSGDAARSCTGASDVTSCIVASARSCTTGGAACTADSDCVTAATYACSTNASKACTNIAGECNIAEKLGTCSGQASKSCRVSTQATDCRIGSNYKGPCINYTAPAVGTCNLKTAAVDNGPCKAATAANYNPCLPASGGYVGDCVFSSQAAAVKGKVVFNQAMQSCIKTRGKTLVDCPAPNYCFVNGDLSSTFAKCPDVYSGFATCSNDHFQLCSIDADCGAGNTCDKGPAAIVPGHPALFCATNYMGQFYELNTSSNWVRKASATDTQIYAAYWNFCSSFAAPPVTDPTDAPSNSPTTDNVPAILSGVGVEAQLGGAIATMRAKVAVTTPVCTTNSDCVSTTGNELSCVGGLCKPSGLVQQFSSLIRFGAMTFNPYGSASETALTGTPKLCKTGSSRADMVCTQDVDCDNPPVSGNCTSTGAVNLDGSRIIHPIGWGYCATMASPAVQCVVDADCGFGNSCQNNGYCGSKGLTRCTTALTCSGLNQACITDAAGDHTVSNTLIKAIDDVTAIAWTPFSEAYYNAIGYFAAVPQAGGSFNSRVSASNATGMRLNALRTTSTDYSTFSVAPADFNESYNPSESRCQQNYILLITDGSSTADRNTVVSTMAGLYAADAGITQTACTGSPSGTNTDYGGNNNLPIMSWIAKNRRIYDVNVSGVKSTIPPTVARDSISSFIVFNGESNGATGDCNSLTLLTKTAANGGTTLKQANDYPALQKALNDVFNDVSAKAASGTAASILSNSEGSGANILQAVFYPKKIFENATFANWIGEMQNLWYFVDPAVKNSTIREDTDSNLKLNLVSDYVTEFFFDSAADMTKVRLKQDSNGDGTGDVIVTPPGAAGQDPDLVKSIWRAGKQLWSRDLSLYPRTIYTPLITGASESATGSGLMKFTYGNIGATTLPNNSAFLEPYLSTTPNDNATAVKLMKWVHGFDFPGNTAYRSRTVKLGNIPASTFSTDSSSLYVTNPRDKGIGVWKLGDIISSTPRVQSTVRLNTYNLPSPGGYNDQSYLSFINSNEYANRGMVYVGGNDGMLHAFNLGILSVKAEGFQKATLSGTDLGKEIWSFIPKNYLPYLKYLADASYPHLYAVDGRTIIADVSIGDTNSGVCVKASYWLCDKPTNSSVVTAANNLDATKNTWRTVVVSGMGLGGASRKTCATDATQRCVQTPINDPADATKGLGYSSYFALDVTDPVNPQMLWEFSNPLLGYATTGPAIVRVGDPQKNGRWFAVFGSGPFGPIDTIAHQFGGKSDHNLRFFIVDLRTGDLVKTIDTGIARAFAGSLIGGAIDADRWNATSSGYYKDDAIYAGYVKNPAILGGDWTDGGVGRIMTKESLDPNDATSPWAWSVIKDGIGPVTTSIARTQDRKNKNLWLYFGTGRYFFRNSATLDDNDGARSLYGMVEPCYNSSAKPGNYLDGSCIAAQTRDIVNQDSSISSVDVNALVGAKGGWSIPLDPASVSKVCSISYTTSCTIDADCPSGQTCNKYGAERVVTDTVALTNGTVFFTSFKPTLDICGYGGNSYLWGVNYATGDKAASNALLGKALIQLSTGEFKEVDLTSAFTSRLNRRMSDPMTGKPPSDAPPIISNSMNRPVKKILHIQEQ